MTRRLALQAVSMLMAGFVQKQNQDNRYFLILPPSPPVISLELGDTKQLRIVGDGRSVTISVKELMDALIGDSR
jgi:hypothetical protein